MLIDPYRTPPIFLTSWPYPIIIMDWLTVSVNLLSGRIFKWFPLELVITADLTAGELRQVLKSYISPWEALSIEASLQSGELRQILKNYTIPWEEISITADLTVGELKVVLIQYENWPWEGISISADLISGTLV